MLGRDLFKMGATPIATLVGGLLLFLVLALWWSLEKREQDNLQRTTQSATNMLASFIERDMRSRLSALQRMVGRWENQAGTPKSDFLKDAQSYITHMPGFQALEWVDDTFHVRWIVPLKGNEKAQNLNLAFEENRQMALISARDRKSPTITKPIDLIQGGKGFLVYFPIHIQGEFQGFILAVFRIQAWLDYVLSPGSEYDFQEEGLEIEIVFSGQSVYSIQSDEKFKKKSFHAVSQAEVLGRHFNIKVTPSSFYISRHQTALPEIAAGTGVLMTILVTTILLLFQKTTIYAWRMQVGKEALEKEVAQRQEVELALKESEERIRAVFDSVIDAIIIINKQAIIQAVNPAAGALFGYMIKELIGKNVSCLMPSDIAEKHDSYIRSYLNTGKRKLIGIRQEVEVQRKDGEKFPARLTVTEMHVAQDIMFVGVVQDITEQKKAEEQIRHLATHDALTNLPSLRLAKDRLIHAMSTSKRHKKKAGVLFLDLDGFKAVNDNFGHDAGDALLKEVAHRLVDCVREMDTVARIGGDEFLIVINEVHEAGETAFIKI